MYLNTKWILKLTLAAFVLLGVASVASAQVRIIQQSLLPPDEARDIHMKETAATGAYAPLLELLAAPFRATIISQLP